MSSCSVVVLGLCKATWGKDVPQHGGQRGCSAEQGELRPPSSPSESCAAIDLNLREVVLSVMNFPGYSSLNHPFVLHDGGCCWEMPKIKTPIQVLERKFLGGGTNQWTPVPVGSSWKFSSQSPTTSPQKPSRETKIMDKTTNFSVKMGFR